MAAEFDGYKYLKSPFCMFELFEVWRNSRQEAEDFNRRVRLYVLDDAKIWKPIDRLRCAKYWHAEFTAFEAEMAGGSPALLGDEDFKSFRHMRDFAGHVGDILQSVADRVQPRNFDEFLEYGFDDPPGGGA
jgi:internalin A